MSSKEKTDVTEIWEGPGAILRRVREAKGLDVPAVAGMLHLSEKKLEALEADDFAQLPEPVYVRGYLKNYARFLDEPAEPILNAYARLKPVNTSDEQPLLDSHVVEDLGSNGHDVVRIISILVVLIVIVAPVIWWWDYLELALEKIAGKTVQYSEQSTASSDTANRESGLSEFIQTPPQVSAEAGADTGVEAAPSETQDSREQPTESLNIQPMSEQAKPETAATQDEGVTSPGSTVIQPLPPPVVVQEVQQPPEPEQRVSSSVPVSKPAPAAAASKETVFEFIASSWVKVRDNNDQVVLIGEYKKGETKKLLGIHAPYKVVLGDANAVRVKIDGKIMDLSRFSSGGVSRFTIKDGQIENP